MRCERTRYHRARLLRGASCGSPSPSHAVGSMTSPLLREAHSDTRPTRMVRQEFLPFAPPLIGEEEISEVVATLRSDWITTGPKTRRFETEFAAYLGAPGALALNSCTAGLHTALVTLGVGAGDEVITTPMTFAASVNVIEHTGARPVLVDAAHALPARYKGRLIGSGPNPVAFSFYATKNLTTGEGGMLTGDPALLDRARVVSLHGMSRDAWRRYDQGGSWHYDILLPGFKYNMTDIQAALGLRQLEKLAGFQRRRRHVVGRYAAGFADLDALELPVERPEVEHAWHLYVLRLVPETLRIDRDRFIAELAARYIGTSVHFIPIHLHPYYRDRYGYAPQSFPVAWSNYGRLLSLPLNPRLTDDDVTDVIEAVRDVVRVNRR